MYFSATTQDVVKNKAHTDDAFSSATLTTLVGSITPETSKSSYCSDLALNCLPLHRQNQFD